MFRLLDEEEKFYKDYQWCLDPMPQWGDLGQYFADELERWLRHPDGWQERESALNCWLMACALSQVINDYLVRGQLPFAPFSRRHSPLLRAWGALLHAAGETLLRLRNSSVDRTTQMLACRWRELQCALSRSIMTEAVVPCADRKRIRDAAAALLNGRFPGRLRRTRIKMPAAFRSQDLTHGDVLRLLGLYADAATDYDAPLLVVGLRTTGEYFAPLAKVYLESKGFATVDFVTIRPGCSLSCAEHRRILRHARGRGGFLVIDEPAQRGNTVKEALGVLHRYGIENARVSVAFPVYPAHTRWKQNLRELELSGAKICTLSWSYWDLHARMKPENIRRILREYYDAREQYLVSVEESPKGAHLDERFGRPERIGWRLKQVYRVRLWDRKGKEWYEDVLAKSVGWGWFGYHAYIEADRLKRYVPPLLGLRSGFLFSRWVNGKTADQAGLNMRRIMSDALAYIFERIDKLPLAEDMTFKEHSPHYCGGERLCHLLSRAYGTKLGVVVQPVLRRVLRRYATPFPTAIDGKMSPREWVYADGRLWKTDYEHHGFGQIELNIADPVFDLASFIFEFRLGQKEMDEVIAGYVKHTNDARVKDKVMLYIWLIAHHNIACVREYLSEPYRYKWSLRENTKYLGDRAYISRCSVEYLADRVRRALRGNRRSDCVLLDIDRMMDNRVWAFPAMTLSGVRSMELFRRQGYRVLIQSSRTLKDVKHYCDCFDIDGGVAECGSVMWDRNARRETVLVPQAVCEQIRQLQSLLLEYPNVYIDADMRYTVKAFHYRDGGTAPVDHGLIENIIVANRLDHLKIMHGETETIVLSSSIDAVRITHFVKSAVASNTNSRAVEARERARGKRLSASSMHPSRAVTEGQRGAGWPVLPPEKRHAGRGGMTGGETETQRCLLLAVMSAADRPRWARLLALIGTRIIYSCEAPVCNEQQFSI